MNSDGKGLVTKEETKDIQSTVVGIFTIIPNSKIQAPCY